MFNIENRRYVGSKAKLMPWIREVVTQTCTKSRSFCDIFAGTGVVAGSMLDLYTTIYINDFLYSNEIVYKAFFDNKRFDKNKLEKIKNYYVKLNPDKIKDNYISKNYGNKFFGKKEAKLIGYIREDIEKKLTTKKINQKEYCILIASLVYSLDRISNTVGHYEAYRKNVKNFEKFAFDLINPIDTRKKRIYITRRDANELSKTIKSDIIFIDPPYNSRQYSRFYHLLETIVKWDKPKLYGTAMKPKEENMSDYCRSCAYEKFEELIENLKCKYIAVTYNNTYSSKSSSSRNKITLTQIKTALSKKGTTSVFSKGHKYFNAGKTNLKNHKEFLFITRVKNVK